MKRIHGCLLWSLFSITAFSATAQIDATVTVTSCENLLPSASIEVFGPSDTKSTCNELLRILQGVKIGDLQSFDKAAYVLSRTGYRQGEYQQIVHELVDIVRLRGLYNKPDRWYSTIDLVVRSYQAFNGIVTPKDIEEFLRSSGPMAKTLSDDGLTNMIIIIKRQRQQGND